MSHEKIYPCSCNNGWDSTGRVCEICQGAGVRYPSNAAPADDDDAQAFFERYKELRYASKTGNYGG